MHGIRVLGSAWHVGWCLNPESPGFRRGLVFEQRAWPHPIKAPDGSPGTPGRWAFPGRHARDPRSRLSMARWVVFEPGVPRLPPRACIRATRLATSNKSPGRKSGDTGSLGVPGSACSDHPIASPSTRRSVFMSATERWPMTRTTRPCSMVVKIGLSTDALMSPAICQSSTCASP